MSEARNDHNMLSRKGQVLTQDFMISIVIFSAILLLSFQIMDASYEKKRWFEINQLMIQDLMRKVDYLIRNPGIPNGWNDDNVVVLGFADEDHVLNLTKFLLFMNMSYSRQRSLLATGGNDFYIALKNESEEIIMFENRSLYAGRLPQDNVEMLLVTKRFVYLRGISRTESRIPAILEGGIWK